jgi:type 2 lantibiotic biosynthesis protein LanM
LLVTLAQRLFAPFMNLLVHVVSAGEIAADHPGRAGQTVYTIFFTDDAPLHAQWLRFLGTYPVVARLVAVTFRNWTVVTDELIARVGNDRPLLEATFASAPLGCLASCSQDAGDSHDHGRTVALLTFESGIKVAYKPKNLAIAYSYMAFARWLNDTGLEPALPLRTIVDRDDYTWEEFIADAPCENVDAVHRFYVRMGMHVRLIQLLGGTDFTSDNVVAHADEPALIDLEALLSPRLLTDPAAEGKRAAAAAAMAAPVRGGLVTARITGEPGRPGADLGALAPIGDSFAPFKVAALQWTENGIAPVGLYPQLSFKRATPRLAGAAVMSTDHFDDVVAGYVAMGAHLRRVHPRLAGAAATTDMKTAVVRYLARNTHIYARMLRVSYGPMQLRDGVDRELCLERMWKGRFPNPNVVRIEIDSLRDLDIPMFGARPDSAALLCEGEVIAPEFFAAPTADALDERIADLPSTTRESDRELIESVLFMLGPSIPRRVDFRTPPTDAPRSEWVSLAARVSDEILDARLGPADEPGWVGASYHAPSDSWIFAALGDDLYTGASGVALVLARVARATGVTRFEAAARGALRAEGRSLELLSSKVFSDPAGRSLGAGFGWAGRLYACEHGAALLDDDTLRHPSRTVFSALAEGGEDELAKMFARADTWDVASGVGGLVAASIGSIDTADILEANRACVAAVAARALDAHEWSDADIAMYPPNRYPTEIMGGEIAHALVLARARARGVIGDSDVSAMPVSEAALVSLTTGNLLALLELDRERALTHIDARLAGVPRDTDALAWLERGELALAAAHATTNTVTHGERYRAVAVAAGERLYDIKQRTGRWIPERLLPDRFNPSAFTGLSAIANFFVQLAHPAPLPSLRTLA